MGRTFLYGKQSAVIVLSTPVDNVAQSSDFILELRSEQAQPPAVLRVGGCGARGARSNRKIDGASIKEAVAPGIAGSRNEDGLVEGSRGPQMRHLGSEIGYRNERARRDFSLQTQVPRLRISRSEYWIGRLVSSIRHKRHIFGQVQREGISTGKAEP